MSEEIREAVRKKYAQAITERTCCGSSGCCGHTASRATQAITAGLYAPEETAGLPEDAVAATFGCGNPTALAELHAGEVVLDLGSGAGLDVLLSARRVGPYGKAYGLDMTEEMLAAARANQAKAGIENAAFLRGYIEDIPLPDNAVDVVISNCVINLSADKDRVLREVYRVLKPGGRLAVADIVITRALPRRVQENLAAWAGCVAGALRESEYREKLAAAGFCDIAIEVTRVYDFSPEEIDELCPGLQESEKASIAGALVSAFIRAKKPARRLVPDKDYAIRVATAADVPAIENLLAANGLTTAGVRENLAGFLVACQQDLLGVIGLEQAGEAVLLRSLAVRADFRKAGIGAALIKRALQTARDAGAVAAYTLTTTAEKYLARFGFTPITRDQVPGPLLANSALNTLCPASSVCMQRRL